ncbi:MAG: glycosyltransferase [Phycisphaerales bacterium]|nr:glycosyltransferase [Phycisphaerales bacterium]
MTVGIVVIGRNEGARLAACLKSVRAAYADQAAVYVDSASRDCSCEIAEAYRVRVLRLDASTPLTAARARNCGAQALLQEWPNIAYLQFIDGDTCVHADWISHAMEYMEQHDYVGAACGRRRERNPSASIYDFLADMEWNTPVGQTEEFGGDVLMRAEVFRKLHGYRTDFIAGEEPELAARMRLAGYHVVRLNHEMTLHEMGMTRFSQWFRRAMRSGHSIAQLYHEHGRGPLKLYRRQWRSTWCWGLALPVGGPLLMLRIARRRLSRGDDRFEACVYAFFTAVAKVPQLMGMLRFYLNRVRRRESVLMEYKTMSAG